MTSKSKSKGNRLEREIRDSLNTAFNTEEFARTPSSGAIMGLSNWEKNKNLENSTKRALGSDIICPSWFQFSIECKNYGDKPNYAKVLVSSDTDLDGWVGEVLFDAINAKRTPILFFRTTRKGTFVVLPKHFITMIDASEYNYMRYKQEFVIVDANFVFTTGFALNAYNDLHHTDIQKWLEVSPIVIQTVENMLTKKGKKK